MTAEPPPPDFAVEAAGKTRAPSRGSYRVVVMESSGEIKFHDFSDLDGAKQYANDVASDSALGAGRVRR